MKLSLYLNKLAESTLATFEHIVEQAQQKLGAVHGVDAGAFEQVTALTKLLNQDLEDYGSKVDACLAGQALGGENNVRVFAVEHIKGLEFEAVFFINVDTLAQRMPELFERFLNVGFTRAATYLGLTCSRQLPAS